MVKLAIPPPLRKEIVTKRLRFDPSPLHDQDGTTKSEASPTVPSSPTIILMLCTHLKQIYFLYISNRKWIKSSSKNNSSNKLLNKAQSMVDIWASQNTNLNFTLHKNEFFYHICQINYNYFSSQVDLYII